MFQTYIKFLKNIFGFIVDGVIPQGIQRRKFQNEGYFHVLQDDNQQLKHDEYQARSDLNYFLRQLKELEKETALYTAIPKAWRKRIDLEIL